MISKVQWDIISADENIETNYTDSYSFSREVEKIIKDNINIQFALAQTYFYKDYQEYSSYKNTIDFISGQDEASQIENLKLCFTKMTFFQVNGQASFCQVGPPNIETLNIFEKLIKTNQLNHFLSYFMLKPFKNDFCETGLYELLTDEKQEKDLVIDDMKKDAFINYILLTKRNLVEQRGFPISGFSMNEIDKDKNIRAFSKLVKQIYIIVSKIELDNQTRYSKYLTWVNE